MLAIAHEREGARAVRATSENLPFRTGSVDIVVSSASLKDWGNRAGGLGEIRRVLRPGGVGLVSDFITTGPGSRPEGFRRRFGVVSDVLRQLAGLVIPFSLDDARGLASAVGGGVRLEADLGVVIIEIRKPAES